MAGEKTVFGDYALMVPMTEEQIRKVAKWMPGYDSESAPLINACKAWVEAHPETERYSVDLTDEEADVYVKVYEGLSYKNSDSPYVKVLCKMRYAIRESRG